MYRKRFLRLRLRLTTWCCNCWRQRYL